MSIPFFATTLCRFLALFLFFSCFWATASAEKGPSSFVKQNQPLELPPLLVYCPDARAMPLSHIVAQKAKDRPFFLHLWAPTCANCHKELRQIDALSDRFETLNIPIITLAQDRDGSITLPAFAKRYEIHNISLCHDPAKAARLFLNPPGLPVTYFVSASKQITATHVGALDWEALARESGEWADLTSR